MSDRPTTRQLSLMRLAKITEQMGELCGGVIDEVLKADLNEDDGKSIWFLIEDAQTQLSTATDELMSAARTDP